MYPATMKNQFLQVNKSSNDRENGNNASKNRVHRNKTKNINHGKNPKISKL